MSSFGRSLRGVRTARVALSQRSLSATSAALVIGASLGIFTSPPSFPAIRGLFVIGIALAVMWGLAVIAWRRPSFALLGLVVLLPFNDYLLARLYLWGINPQLVGASRFWKELVIGVLLMRLWTQGALFLDRINFLILVFLGLVGLYVLLPIGPPMYVRLLGARSETMFLLLFLVARHLRMLEELPDRLESAVLVVGLILAVLAIWNTFWPDDFARWIVSTGVHAYRGSVLGGSPGPIVVHGRTAGESVVLAGSLFLSAITLAYFLVIPIGLVLGRLVTGRVRWRHAIAGGCCAAALLLTQSRSAIAALPLMALLAFAAGSRRIRLALGIALALVVLLPLAGSRGLSERASTAFDPTNVSTQNHIIALRESRARLADYPFGTGLGTVGGISRRFDVAGRITNESWYLQVGSEVGVIGMLLYFAIVVLVLQRLWAEARSRPTGSIGALCALAAVAAGGLVLHTLEEHATAWTLWIVVGLALRPRNAETSIRDADRAESTGSDPGRAPVGKLGPAIERRR